MTDYFKLLNLRPGASRDEIRKAYRKFAFHFHPDRNRDKGYLFLLVHEAYEKLMEASLMKEKKESLATSSDIPPRRKKKAIHNMAFVKEKIRKFRMPNAYQFRVPKVLDRESQCPACRGYGVKRNAFNLAVECVECGGSGKRFPELD